MFEKKILKITYLIEDVNGAMQRSLNEEMNDPI